MDSFQPEILAALNEKFYKKLNTLCKPILQKVGADQLCFDYFSAKGDYWALNTDKGLHEYYLQMHGPMHDPMVRDPKLLRNSFNTWDTVRHKDYNVILSEFANSFNISNGISFTRLLSDGGAVGIAIGGTEEHYKFIPLLIKEQNLVNKIIRFLHIEFNEIVKQSNNYGINIPQIKLEAYYSLDIEEQALNSADKRELLEFLGAISADDQGLANIKLTKRQDQCADLALRGFTAEASGNLLGISTKVVTEHLDAIKKKLSVKSKRALKERLMIMKDMDLITEYFYDHLL